MGQRQQGLTIGGQAPPAGAAFAAAGAQQTGQQAQGSGGQIDAGRTGCSWSTTIYQELHLLLGRPLALGATGRVRTHRRRRP